MTFNPNIPAANDLINQSQAQLQTNFSQANTIFDVDHVTFDDATVADRGKHRQCTYPELGGGPTTLANEGAVYTLAGAAETELYYRRESNGEEVQLSIFRAWANFQGSPVVINDSFNIASIVRNGPGDYTVTFVKNMRNANYGVLCTSQMTADFLTGGIVGIAARAVSNFRILVKSLTAAAGTDLNPISFMVIQS